MTASSPVSPQGQVEDPYQAISRSPKDFTGETSGEIAKNTLTEMQFLNRIRKVDLKTNEQVFEIADVCAAVRFQKKSKANTLKRAGMSAISFSKYVSIANDSRLRKPDIRERLPRGFPRTRNAC